MLLLLFSCGILSLWDGFRNNADDFIVSAYLFSKFQVKSETLPYSPQAGGWGHLSGSVGGPEGCISATWLLDESNGRLKKSHTLPPPSLLTSPPPPDPNSQFSLWISASINGMLGGHGIWLSQPRESGLCFLCTCEFGCYFCPYVSFFPKILLPTFPSRVLSIPRHLACSCSHAGLADTGSVCGCG